MQNYYYNPAQASATTRQYIGLKGRPVSSLEEVRAATVDFDGSVSFFPDLANGKIYTKQCNIDGTASLNMYEIKEIPIANNNLNPSAYVTREEFQQTLKQLKEAIQQTKIVEKSPDQTQSSQTSVTEFKF